MTKKELAIEVATRTGKNLADVELIINSTVEVAKKAISGKKEITIRGFGTLKPVYRAPKLARNIGLGKEVNIPAHYVVAFKPAREFKKEVAGIR
jgi:DNA-binding protein HU-beta